MRSIVCFTGNCKFLLFVFYWTIKLHCNLDDIDFSNEIFQLFAHFFININFQHYEKNTTYIFVNYLKCYFFSKPVIINLKVSDRRRVKNKNIDYNWITILSQLVENRVEVPSVSQQPSLWRSLSWIIFQLSYFVTLINWLLSFSDLKLS